MPPYSPRVAQTPTSAATPNPAGRTHSVPTLLPSADSSAERGPGLPPIPPRRASEQGWPGAAAAVTAPLPSLGQFRIPSWSTISANPTARHYHSVAHRRVTAAASPAATVEGLRRMMTLSRAQEDEEDRVRPLEDPYLVGEEAARRTREERLARENGDEVLIREDRRWDWFLGMSKNVPLV